MHPDVMKQFVTDRRSSLVAAADAERRARGTSRADAAGWAAWSPVRALGRIVSALRPAREPLVCGRGVPQRA